MVVRFLVAAFVAALPLASAHAEMEPIPGEERFASLMPQNQQTIGAGLGVEQIGNDYFLQLVLKTELNLGPVGLGLQIPLNLRIVDKDPKAHGDYYGIIRREDWDQKSEYLRVIRYVRLGHKRDEFYLRVGELAADLGHGTIVNHYLNNVDVNTFRVGAAFDVNTDYGGIETLASDLGALYDSSNPRSRLLGTRLYFKPLALMDPDSFWNIFAVGASLVSDLNAPASYAVDASGQREIHNGAWVVDKTTHATVYGFDLEAEVLHSAILDIIPYTDLNFIDQAGWGWHLGTLATFKMPIGFSLSIPIRLEYRRFASNYVPEYFNTFYEIDRFSYGISSGEPKATAVRNLPQGQGINGYYGDLAFDFAGLVQVGAVYEDYQGANPNLQAFVAVPALEVIQFKAYYARTGIKGADDIFKFDDRSMAIVEGRYEMVSYVYLVGRLTERWELDTDPASSHYNDYVAKRDWKVGIEMSLTL